MRIPRSAPHWLTACALLIAFPLATHEAVGQAFHVEGLRTEYAVNPIGIDEPAPRLDFSAYAYCTRYIGDVGADKR